MTDATNVASNQSSLDDRLSKLRVQLPPPKLNKTQNADVSYEYGSFGVENRIESPVPSKARQSFGGILNYLNVEPVQQPTKAKYVFQYFLLVTRNLTGINFKYRHHERRIPTCTPMVKNLAMIIHP